MRPRNLVAFAVAAALAACSHTATLPDRREVVSKPTLTASQADPLERFPGDQLPAKPMSEPGTLQVPPPDRLLARSAR